MEILHKANYYNPPSVGEKPSKRELARIEANATDRREGLPKLKVGMTVDEIGKIMPLTFTRQDRNELRKIAMFTASVDGYDLQFARGVLTDIKPPVTAINK
ncbi:MAG: hypothetical protein ACXWDN_13140 [Limisphaerales bacterium]